MLLAAERLIGTPVMSLQTGGRLAKTKSTLIDPRNLMIIAYELDGLQLDQHPSFLRVDDIRELSQLGFIVDSSDEFVGVDDILKIKEVYDFGFSLQNILVQDEYKHKLGKVTSYSVEPGSFLVKQINVKRPLLKSLNDTELLIDRSQIFEVTNDAITIKNDERQAEPAKDAAKVYSNPFRQAAQPETINVKD